MEHWIRFSNYDGEDGERFISFYPNIVENYVKITYGAFFVYVNDEGYPIRITWNGKDV